MRIRSLYISRKAAQDVNSIFEAMHIVKKIDRDGKELWEIVKREEKDDQELEIAERDAEIPDIIREEKEEIKDIEDLANQTFAVMREGLLLIHTQLDKLKKLMKEDEALEDSGFPIEVADQLENMLQREMSSIVQHLREMSSDMKNDNSPTKNTDNISQ